MVSVAGILIFAQLMLSLAFPAWAAALVNLGTEYAFEDYNATGHGLGNPIVGAPFNSSFPPSQWWGLGIFEDPQLYSLLTVRPGQYLVGAHVDGLEGQRLNVQTQGYSSAFLMERPFGNGTEVRSFIFANAYPELAITSSTVPNKPLYLAPYDRLNKYQHWEFVRRPPTGSQTAAGPGDPKSLPTASLSEVIVASAQS